jgi:putative ABC transport system permease protein
VRLTAALSREVMGVLWNAILKRMEGYFPYVLSPQGIVRMMLIIFAGYMIVMLIDFRRIRHIPMDEALKNME